MPETDYRIEHDTMGEVRVPASALYGAQTQRAVENFPVSGSGLEAAQIVALARIKRAAALTNGELGVLPQEIVDAIVAAADEVIGGGHLDQFPIDVYQTGSGTSSNMNVNEVLAAIANRRIGSDRAVHPNDHVNASQSSNDVFPTSVHVAATEAVLEQLVPALEHLAESLEARSAEWAETVKPGRTHLMDATPVTLGQEFGGYARQIRLGIERVRAAVPRLAEVPLGGSADHGGGGPLRGAGGARRARRDVRGAARARRQPDQDLQRHPLDGLGTEHRARRAAHPRPAAGLLDHAGQGESGHP
jgi:fumarate hydratase class II